MTNRFRSLFAPRAFVSRSMAVLAILTLAACGGGGGGGSSFLPADGQSDLAITAILLPDVVQLPYAEVLEATGGTAPYSWSLVNDDGTGVTLDDSGVLRAAAPIEEGTYGITVSVRDNDGNEAERSFTIEFLVPILAITSTALPPAERDIPYSAIVEVTGGAEPYAWELIEDGDTGLSLDATGILSGTIGTPGTYGLTIKVTDDTGVTSQRSLLLTVTGEAIPPLGIDTVALPSARENATYAAVVSASGGDNDSYSWQLVSAGGSGLTLSSNGVLSGQGPDEGSYGLTVRVSDGTDTATKSLTLTVAGPQTPLAIETTTLPSGVVGVPYAAAFNAVGGSGSYTWSLVSGGGSGLGLTSSGVLSGVPASNGAYGVTVSVSDGDSTVVTSLVVTFALQATDGGGGGDAGSTFLSIATETLPNITTSIYAAILDAEGGTPPYTWALVPGPDTPAGFAVSTDGAVTLATDPPPGIYPVSVQVTDSAGTVVTKSYAVTRDGGAVPAVEFTTDAALPSATTGTLYATVIRASGDAGASPPYAFRIVGVSPVPPGTLAIGADSGVLEWDTPSGGPYDITIEVVAENSAAVRVFTLTVAAP
ncbi:Ig family protein [Luminiphilus syltensis NOR5-1B]|uniref:Ig family protein n=1 Tax=Luminiphilus syltensis NOR5-1B TaxID=565045 RepID=B8KUF1_9GAMM|nr:putative Ig domain-containing protein [Luminiphilus syltensis]EED36208.1 Ig family protein [Luminiphilus syltensis NOR5-1B]